MPSRNPPNQIELDLDARLMTRLRRYAATRGLSFEDVLLQSVQSFLDGLPASEFDPPLKSVSKRAARKGG
ncbi:hypothetical protein G3N95_24375 [Paraburkholderia sp. Tr-20389]|uniref:hypothetical protein n=1 Tax=Paraburkholderia sp. Tr-20389 TaxID=2703903 RepID=UPI00197F55AE|nr:hypothetical protein [Paraburkholderia sp. Tr-20389]MBN3756099.1 hypothetical protein [Paraburkholderia sp. Tr-20389]